MLKSRRLRVDNSQPKKYGLPLMAEKRPSGPDEWRLGLEPAEPGPPPAQPPPAEPAPTPDLSATRLDRPLYAVTVERLGWLAVALYAVLSRLLVLGMRPLNPRGAGGALFALRLWRDGLNAFAARPEIHACWLHVIQAMVFAACGASDFTARLTVALFGLILVGAPFALRRDLGRAGALGFAAILALSPAVTYFSRSTGSAVPVVALAVVALALVCAVGCRPSTGKVAALGCVAGLAMATGPASFALAAIFVVVLIAMGIGEAIFGTNAGIRLRVWWERRAALTMVGVVAASAVFYLTETAFLRRSLFRAILADARPLWETAHKAGFNRGIAFYLPALAFYDFMALVLAVFAALAFIAFRVRSRLAAAAFLWTAFAGAFFLVAPERRPDWIVMLVVPAAMLAGAGIDWLHHTGGWRFARYPIAVLAILTLYVQIVTSFVYAAPDPTEAPWLRHALLYWSEPFTTYRTPAECRRAEQAAPRDARVLFVRDEPALQWYLRNLGHADDAASADLVVLPAEPSEVASPDPTGSDFTFEERWKPRFARLTASDGLRYFFAMRAWSKLDGRDVRIELQTPRPPVATKPEAIPAPSPTPSPSPAATPSPGPSARPTPSPSPSMSATPTPESTPSATSTPPPG
jgi:uncharacterized protein (TIGR03663 family)